MKNLKKVLSLVLALAMVLTYLPSAAYASNVESDVPVEISAESQNSDAVDASEDEAAIAEEENSMPENVNAVSDGNEEQVNEAAVEQIDAQAEDDVEDLPASGISVSDRPSDSTVSGCPFVKGTGGSNSFRIPSMVTLSDGTLVAAADARWNTTYDGGCGDTVVARSSDNGSTWKYTFANYLGDNGNSYNGSGSTCFIDPALAVTSNDTIYMLVDLYPYGVALNGSGNTTPSTAVGFNSDGYLKLSTDGSNYNYYLKDGKIYDSSNTEVSGYTVDGKFNVSYNGSDVSNLFFSDSPYKVVRTGYLYLTKSTDKGATWSDPTLIPNVKTSSEQVCLVGPGRGNVLSDGTIMFPIYSYSGEGTQRVGFIYSTDNGSTWTRSNSSINWSSEAAIVEVNSSTLRVFYRNGNAKICYVDVKKNGNSYTWGSAVTTSVACNSNTQLSAIKVTSGDTDYILVSCPGNESTQTGSSYRTNGQIVTFKASDMSKVATTSVPSVHTSNSFMYSCMSQLSNGNVAILYEDQENQWGTGSNCYYQMSFKTYALSDLGIEETVTPTGSDTITDDASTATVKTADGTYLTSITSKETTVSGITNDYVAYDITLNGGDFTGKATVTLKLSDALKNAKSLTGFVIEDGAVTKISGSKTSDGNYYTFVTPHFSTLGVMSLDEAEQAYDTVVILTVGNTSDTYTVSSDTNLGSESKTTTDGIASYVQTGTDATSGTTYTKASATCNNIISSNSTSWKSTSYYYTPDNGTNYYPVYAKRSSSGRWSTTYSYTWGYSTASSSSNVTQIGETQSTTSTSTTANITVYTKSGSGTATPASTTIKFTGVTAGTTYVTVGTTTYKVVVSAKTSTESVSAKVGVTSTLSPTVPTGGSVSYEVTSGSNYVTVASDGTVTPVAEGSATVVATVMASNGKATEVITYTITVADRGGAQDAVSVAIGEDKTLSVDLKTGETVEWTSSDSSVVGIAGDDTAVATLIGTSAGTATITGTVKDAAGNVTATYTWTVTVTDSNTNSKYIYVNIATIEHTTVYYAVNGGELIKVNGTGVLLNKAVTGHYQLAFFAAPDDGYALTYMSSTNSAGEYYCLSDGTEPDGTDGSAWPFADSYDWATKGISTTGGDSSVYDTSNGFRWGLAEGNVSIAELRNLYARAIALGCDGTLVFTKNNAGTTYDLSSNGNNLHSELVFVSQPLPKLSKTIKTIGGETYTAGTSKVSLGDEIVYNVAVTRPATNETYGTITYSNEALYDKMTNGNTTLMASGTMGTSTTSDKTYSYETKITLSLDNYDDIVKDGKITNTADFSYSYKSKYSNGTLTASANASADQISIDAPTYVVDFGLPVSFTIEKSIFGSVSAADITATASYGNVSIADGSDVYNVAYTPNTVIQNIDTLKFTVSGNSYIVLIYPATTVYYEETFASGDDWTKIGTASGASQTASVLGANTDNYGYDGAYSATTGESDGTAITSTSSGNTDTFTFTGTGVDIYATCTKTTGNVAIYVKDTAGKLMYFGLVDTASINGTSALTTYDPGNLYNVPIASVSGLTHDTYTVTMCKLGSASVTLDGFRVYNTLDDSSVYAGDLEDNPYFVEARDLSFVAVNREDMSADYANDATKQILEKVETTDGTTTGTVTAILYSANEEVKATADLIDNGPKNEIYLYPGMSMTFAAKTTREVQIGLRGLQECLTCTVNDEKTKVSTTDMFYTAKAQGSNGTITITNPSTNDTIIAVTKIKVCDAPSDAIAPLTEASVMDAMVALGFESEVTYADATANINLVDYSGKVLATTSLTSNGVEGETASFAASDITAAAKSILPSGYAFVKESAIADASAAYGESTTVKIQIGKVATLKINYKKLLGRGTLGSATLTHVQTSSSTKYTFTTAEIKAAAPAGAKPISLIGTSVKYGQVQSLNVTCR